MERGNDRDSKEEERWNAAARELMQAANKSRGMDLVWTHPSGGRLYLGDDRAAMDAQALQQHGITHIVNSTKELPFYHEGVNSFVYYRFVISESWRLDESDPRRIRDFFSPPLEFMHR